MDRCPVCQSPVRADARFCTICGFRLPDAADSPAPASTEPGPVAEAAPAPGWPAPPSPFAEQAAPAGAADEAGTSTPVDGGPSDWPSPISPDVPSSSAAPIWPTPEAVAQEDSVVAWGAALPPQAPLLAEESPEPAAETADPPGDADPPPVAHPDMVDGSGDAGVAVPDEAAESAIRPGPGPAPAWGFATDADEDPPRLPALSSTASHSETDARERLAALLDEARALLPLVGGRAPAAHAFDAAALAADLDAAAAAPDGDLSGLMAAIEDARANPTAVGVVLALSRHVDDVVALAEAHDRLADVARRAAASLRGPGHDAGLD